MWYSRMIEKRVVPDLLIRIGIRKLLKDRLLEVYQGGAVARQERFMQLVETLKNSPIAESTREANEQHYEVPTEFFQLVLGRFLKYSCGFWRPGVTSLDQAEEDMLALTVERADLQNGQDVLELGCGWGSLSLYMAERFPGSSFTSVSNSSTQKAFIDAEIKQRGLTNLKVVTCDMNEFHSDEKFDRVVSVEMFEHMRNYKLLLEKISNMLRTDGRLFVHIFTHREGAYLFEVQDDSDWMAKYFFTGGVMPSDHLLLYFSDSFQVESHWRVNGTHYQKTAEGWLSNMDRNRAKIEPILAQTYGESEVEKWWSYWRIFFMACAELWGYKNGEEWMVSHYRFTKK